MTQRWVFAFERSMFSSLQLLLHLGAQRFPVHATGDFRLQPLHYGTHLRFGCGADFGDGFAHDLCQLICIHRLWQICVQDRQLFSFLFGKFRAAAFFKALDRILALLRLLANDLRGLSVIQLRFSA
jgi:hypothetical protein